MKKAVSTKKGMAAVGPYSPAIVVGDLIFCSGHIGKDPKTDEFVPGGIAEQTEQTLTNLKYLLEEAGGSMETVIKTTAFLKSMDDYASMNDVYARFFKKPYPARSTVQIVKLPKDALVEIDAIAYVNPPSPDQIGIRRGEGGCSCGGNCSNC